MFPKFCIGTIVFLALCGTGITKGDDSVLIDSLEKGIDAWLAKANFKCTYIHSEGVVSEESTAANYPDRFDKRTLQCNGTFVKSGDKVLLSQYVQYDFYEPAQAMNAVWAVSDVLELDYVPKTEGGQPLHLFVGERPAEKKNIPCPNGTQMVCETPLTYTGGPAIPNPLSGIKLLQKEGSHSKIECQKEGENLIRISLYFEDGAGNKNESTVIISTEYSYPIPIRKIIHVIYHNGKEYTGKCEASDFIDVGNGIMIPQRISAYRGPMQDWRGKEYQGKWLVNNWITKDLGKEKPSNDDFLIKLAPDTRFSGFEMGKQKILNREKSDIFDFNSLRIEDLQNPLTIARESNSTGSYLVRLTLMVAGSILIIIALIRLWKERMSKNIK